MIEKAENLSDELRINTPYEIYASSELNLSLSGGLHADGLGKGVFSILNERR